MFIRRDDQPLDSSELGELVARTEILEQRDQSKLSPSKNMKNLARHKSNNSNLIFFVQT